MTAPQLKPAPPIDVGVVVADKYRVEALIGIGGMGFVFAALHLQLGHRVALKVLHSSAISDPEVVQRFLREGRALARLQGEHIARVSDVGTLPSGEPYLVMEFLEGQDLSRVLSARGPLPLEEVVEFVAQTCEALAEAHVRGIVHRDLKPANLFLSHKLDGDVSVKVLDFGISKVSSDGIAADAENITVTSTLVGTPKYMSPEQIQDSRNVDSRTDIWGLGTIFYELLTQKRPFAAPTLALVCVKVLHEEVPPPSSIRPDIPPGVDAIIARCLKKTPGERYANVGELAEALIPFGNPSVRSSTTRVQRILTSGARLMGADSSGSIPGLVNVPTSTPSVGGGAVLHTPSAARVADKEAATMTAGPTLYERPLGKIPRSRLLAIGGAGVAAVVALVVILFLALRAPSTAEGSDGKPGASGVASTTTPPATGTAAATAPTATATETGATTAESASAVASAVTAPTIKHTWVRPGGGGHHPHPTATATTTAAHPTATATDSAPPKGTGDVLEDRR